MTIFYCSTGASAERISFTLGENLVVCTSAREIRQAIDGDLNEKLVLLGADLSMNLVKEITNSYRISRPTLGFVLLRNRLDVSTMNEAIQAGVREVVAADDSEGIVNACKRSVDISQKLIETVGSVGSTEIRSGKTIIVFSAKGGCGKTTLSINLARALAADPDTKVCLVDFDLQFGDVGVALHVEPGKNISNILNTVNIDQLSLKSVVYKKEENFDLLLAPNNPADVERIDANLANSIISNLKSMYDYTVIDSPPAFTDVILKAFDLSDAFILLTTLDMPAIKNLKISMQTLSALGLPEEHSFIVLNRSDSKAGLTADDVEAAIERSIFAKIPTSIDVPATTNKGLAIVEKYPKHKVSKEIFRIANGIRIATNGKQLPPKKSRFRGKSK